MPLRSCWTCRLRRKGCTGEQPCCSGCRLLNITCHGYGPKPVWLDGGAQEKANLQEIKEAVKRTTEKQRRPRAIKSLKVARERKALTTGSGVSKSKEIPDNSNPIPAIKAIPLTDEVDNGEDQIFPWTDAPEDESLLLMHYLEFVYPLQFPFYKPRAEHGGRGWTLAVLRRCRPLYNAALSLGAFHQQLVLPPPESKPKFPPFPNLPPVAPWCRQGLYYSLALAGLREHIGILMKRGRGEVLRDSIDVLACITQLILLDVSG